MDGSQVVVLTDHPWPSLDVEQEILGAAGFALVSGPIAAPPSDEVEAMVRKADPVAILTCWAQVSEAAIRAPRDLRIVARLGIGLDNIAVDAASARGAWVTNVPDYCIGEVADHAVALAFAALRGVTAFDRAAKQGRWEPQLARLERVADLTIGIIGYGKIGRATAARLRPHGCRILAHSRSLSDAGEGVEAADLATMQRLADVIILHLPLTDTTHGLVNDAFLSGCARRPLIVNVSRGGLVDNDALLRALADGRIRGAALDVVDGEPSPPPAILRHEAIIVTPHIAFSSEASLIELRRRACEEVVRVLSGHPPVHPCNLPGMPLSGGVACDVRVIEAPGGKIVVKRALDKLRVAADWFADPARAATEVAALRAGRDLLGADAVPEVLWEDRDHHSFAMRFVPPPFGPWKERLLAGQVDRPIAARAGQLLGRLHARSAAQPALARDFADLTHFEALRLDPFFRRTAAAAPHLAAAILAAGAGMAQRRTALVHGDYSPKNLLTDGEKLIVIDWEVAHWGDPRFDVAFCLSHLLLKAHRQGADQAALIAAGEHFGTAYRTAHQGLWDRPLVAITGALLVTRLLGPSPIDYRGDVDEDAVMALAARLLGVTADARALPFFAQDLLNGL